MTVARICTREVHLVPAAAPVRDAALLMEQDNLGSLVVIDPEQRPIGLLTDRDLVTRVMAPGLDTESTQVHQVMSALPRTIDEHATMEAAVALMRGRRLRRLPVVDAGGKLVGIVSIDDVLSLLAEELAEVGEVIDAASPRPWAQHLPL